MEQVDGVNERQECNQREQEEEGAERKEELFPDHFLHPFALGERALLKKNLKNLRMVIRFSYSS